MEQPDQNLGNVGKVKRRRRWPRRVFLSIAWFLIAVVVLVAGYSVIANYRGRAARDRIIAKLEKRGVPTDLSYLENNDEKDTAPLGTPSELGLKEQARDGTRFYLAAFEMASFPLEYTEDIPFRGFAHPPELCEPIDAELAQSIHVYLAIQKDFYSLIESARKCERFNYNVNILHELDRGERLLDLLQGFRASCRQLRVLCLYKQAFGNAEGALDVCAAILDMNQSLNDEPWSMVWLVRAATGQMAKEDTEQTLSRLSPDAGALNALRLRFLAESDSVDIQKMMEAETALAAEYVKQPGIIVTISVLQMEHLLIERRWDEMVSRYQEMYSHEFIRKEIGAPPMPSKRKINLILDYLRIGYTLYPGMWQSMHAREAEKQLKFYDLAGLPSHELAERVSEIIKENKNDGSDEAAISRGFQQFLSHQANMRVAATALSVEIYRIRHGDWPVKLGDADDAYPVDPFSGKELVYKLTDSGCTVYSIGMNQKDDGGRFSGSMDIDEDDLAFQLFNPELRNKPSEQSDANELEE